MNGIQDNGEEMTLKQFLDYFKVSHFPMPCVPKDKEPNVQVAFLVVAHFPRDKKTFDLYLPTELCALEASCLPE